MQAFKNKLALSCSSNTVVKKNVNPEWKNLIYSFHKMDSQSFGPINTKNPTTKLDLRSQIYSWPYSNHCLADQQVYKKRFDPLHPITLPYNSKSLDTIEYLVYAPLDKVKCNLKAHPYLNQWLALDDTQKINDRCQLALELTENIEVYAQKLSDSWNRHKINYSKIITVDKDNNLKAAINEFSDALYNIESIKDIRLGGPLGKNKNICSNDKCPDAVEHLWSDMGLIAIQARLDGFTEGFWGGLLNEERHHGFDDYLHKSQHQDITEKMKNLITRAQSILLQMNESNLTLKELIQNVDLEKCKISDSQNLESPICSFYETIRSTTRILQTEVLVALSLKSPPVYQGDND